MKLKTFFALVAMLLAFLQQAEAQNNNHIPGTVACWGDQVISYATPDTKFIKIAAGGYHDLGLKSDGTVVAWGDNSSGESTVPIGLTGVASIAAGTSHSLALKSNGTVVAWGDNSYGQSMVPTNLTGVISIAAGAYHSLALKAGGTVVAWGANTTDQGTTWTGQSSVPANATNIVAIAAGDSLSLALKSDGTVVSWGASGVFNGVNGVIAIAAGHTHYLALKSDGTVVASGTQYAGYYTSPVPATVPTNLTGVVAIAAGDDFSLALKSDGTVVMWGVNYIGVSQVPVGLNGVTAIAASSYHSLILKNDGTIGAWGYYSYNSWNYYFENPVGIMVPGGLNSVVAIAADLDGDHNLALNSDGTVVAWGDNYWGESTIPAGLSNVVAIASGGSRSLAVKNDGTVAEWGDMSMLGWLVYAPAGLNGVVGVAAGGSDSLALKSDGTVVTWGDNSYGQLNVPANVTGVAAISAGWWHSLALKSDGTVVAWGYNQDGETNVPANLTGVIAIAAGKWHNLALKSDGTVVAWGYNQDGETNVPVNLTNVIGVAAGESYSLAIKNDGTVVGWGTNYYNASTAPAGLNGVISIAGGGSISLALVGPSNQSPAIINQPSNQIVQAGSNASFTVSATGYPPPNYQWQFNGQNLAGQTATSLSFTNVQFANAGGYLVIITNAYGAATSATATLKILAIDTNVSPKQLNPNPLPTIPSGKDSLCIVTHGFTGVYPQSMPAWVNELAGVISNKAPSNWLVVPYDWSKDAGISPDFALYQGGIDGALLGKQLSLTNWQQVHLIAHSAGAVVIEAIAEALSASPSHPRIQMTFLDPYVGFTYQYQNVYGQAANWSDCYSEEDFTGGFTAGSLAHAYNVDVSWVDPAHETVPWGLSEVAFSTHEYSHEFYLDTVTNTSSSWCGTGYGFGLSQEVPLGWTHWGNLLPGFSPLMLCASANALQNPNPALATTLVAMADANHAISSLGASLLSNTGFLLSSLSQAALPNGVRAMALTPSTNSPAWLAVGLTVTNPVNFIQFDSGFTDTNMAQGLVTVYWDTNQIGMVDERVASTNVQTYRFMLPATVTSGSYVLGFRLDAFNNTSSSVSITNVAMGFVGVTQPITLGISLTNGVPRLQLTGPAGYSYLVQTSTNLVDWTPTVLLANTNGKASFVDSLAVISSQRFYRADLFSVITVSPTLQAQLFGNNIVITWPSSAQNFSLQSTTNLANPSSWTTLTNVPAIVNSLNTITNPVSSGSCFYRLKM